ncbi:MAG TPA: enoyl-CoA hydratase/isomerase family protein, partial [Acidimicrobiales bacterium]|nr:enoyl-CoA hydratase/isomerase family protein [Acidimicrobiales bacterium]
MSAQALFDELRRDVAPERSGAVLVMLEEGLQWPDAINPDELARHRLAGLPFVVVGTTRGAIDERWLALCDVVVADGDPALERIEDNLATRPVTCATLALLLRGQLRLSVDDGLVAESAAYSVLQSGPEFAAWRAAHPPHREPDPGPRVRVERGGDVLRVTLTRPQRLNALDTQMRDELVEALTLAALHPGITDVELRGEGKAFCAGGDLDEFGSRPDPATAHLVRLERSVARTLSRLTARTTAYVH